MLNSGYAAKGPFVSLKMIYRKMFLAFSDVCFAKNKWSMENIFLINWKSNHFSVKCLTDLKNIKHFTSFFSFFFRKIFSHKLFSKKHFSENDFPWNKRSQKKKPIAYIIFLLESEGLDSVKLTHARPRFSVEIVPKLFTLH